MLGLDGDLFRDDLFHVGVLVPDLAAAMDEMGRSHGLTFAKVQDRPMRIWMPDRGVVTYQLALTYSCDGPVHVELMQGEEGSPWHTATHRGLHHFGVWADDIGAEVDRLVADGWTIELAAGTPDERYGRFAYLRSPAGVLVEPVSRAAKSRFEAWWAGGDLAPAPTR